jgi:hypothetical protein
MGQLLIFIVCSVIVIGFSFAKSSSNREDAWEIAMMKRTNIK